MSDLVSTEKGETIIFSTLIIILSANLVPIGMLMRIITFRIKVLFFFLLLFFNLVPNAAAQCPTVSQPNQSFCDLQSPTIANLAATSNGNGLAWYATATSTTPLSMSSGLTDGEDYFADNNSGSCGVRQSVTVTIYSAPVGQNFQGVCVDTPGNATISDLIATGNAVKWYNVAIGGSPLAPSTVLVDNTIYYASQTNPNTGCETSRLSVFVNVGVVPVPTGAAIQQFCIIPGNMPTVGDLVASGTNNWYFTSSSAASLDDDELLVDGHSYFATTVDPPCESDNRLEVIAQFVPQNDAGNSATITRCQGASPATLNLFSSLGGSPDTNGTWTGPIATTGGHLGTLNTTTLTPTGSPYVFTYTVPSAACGQDVATVTINVVEPPSVSYSSNVTICSGGSASISFSGTENSVIAYNINGGPTLTLTLNSSGIGVLTGNYTSNTNINLISITTPAPGSCSQPIGETIVITVPPPPSISLGANVTICTGESATVTFTGNPNATVTYTVNGGANQTIVLNGSGTATITGTYTATTTFALVSATVPGTPSCTLAQNDTMTITVVSTPTVTIHNSVGVCPGGSATVSFIGTPNATVTYTINGGPNQTIVLNGSGNASFAAAYNVTSVIALVSVATGPGCIRNLTNFITIFVRTPPAITISGATTVCPGGSATVTFSGTANSTVTYTVNGGPNQTIVLNASGTASITSTYAATTTYTLVSAALSGNPPCSAPQSGSTVITVAPPPTVTLSANQSICSGQIGIVTFTGTPNATVTYNIDGGPNQTIVLNASGFASISNTYTANTTFNLVSVASPGAGGCVQPVTGSSTISMTPQPTVTIHNSVGVCPGGSATVSFIGTPNATVTYTMNGGPNQTIVLNASGNASFVSTYSVTTVVALVSITTTGGCVRNLTNFITIIVRNPPTITLSPGTTVCPGGSATVTFSGTANSTVTYTVNGGPNQTIVLNASGTASITSTYAATTTYTLVSAALSGNPPCSAPQSGSTVITVAPPPTVTLSANQSICPGQIGIVTFTGTPNATVTYNIDGGPNQTIVLNASGFASISNTYTANTTFNLVSVASPGAGGCVQPVTGSSTISMTPQPTVTIHNSVGVCPGGSATVSFIGTPNATVTYTMNGGPNQTIVLNASGNASFVSTYNVTTVVALVSITTTGGCVRNLTNFITIIVRNPPTITLSPPTTVCPGGSATVTFSGTANSTVTYTVNGGPNQTIVLNASGTASITSTYAATTTYTLVSAALSGNPPCSAPQSGSTVITVAPPPTVTLSANQSICPGQIGIVTFTGTPNATVTYNIDGGPNQTIVLNASGFASISNTYTANTTFNLVSVASPGAGGCVQPVTGSSTISMTPQPTVTIHNSVGVCPGGSATVSFIGTPNATVTYTMNGGPNQTIVLNASGNASFVSTYNVTTVVALVSITTTGGCVRNLTNFITIIVRNPPTITLSAPTTVCPGGSATVTFSGTANSTVTYTVNGGPNQTIVLNASGTATITSTYATTTTYTLVSAALSGNPPCSAPQSGSTVITVAPPPTVTLSANQSICPGDIGIVTFTGTPNSTITYTVNGGPAQTVVLNASGFASVSNTYTAAATFTLVSAASPGTGGCVQPVTGTSTISMTPAPTVAIQSDASVCPGGSATVSFVGTPNATVTYTVNGGANQTIVLNAAGNASFTTTYNATTVIALVNVSVSGGCTLPTTESVTISVLPPVSVALSTSQNVCSGNSATVTFTGTPNTTVTYTVNGGANQTIVLDAAGTATITSTYAATTTYTLVSAAPNGNPGCSQPQTGTTTVTVSTPPTASITATSPICSGNNATVTFTGTPNATVTYTVNGGANQTVVLNTAGTAVVTAAYTATTTFGLVNVTGAACTQPLSTTAVITVVPAPTVALSANQTTCAGNPSAVTFSGTPNSTVSYTVNGGPTQTIILDGSGTAVLSATYATNTTIALVDITTSGSPSCTQPITGSSIVTISTLPVASLSADVNICEGSQATITFSGTANAIVTYTINGGANQTITLDAAGTATINNTFFATTTYAIISVSTTGSPGCSQPQTDTMTVNVAPAPTAAIASDATICNGESATVTFTGTANATVTYTVNGGAAQTVVLDASGTAAITANYSATTIIALVDVTAAGPSGCVQPINGSVTITVLPLPTASVAGSATICSGNSATITFTGTANATVTYTTNGGAPQTILLDASGAATITATYAADTTIDLVSVAATPTCIEPATGSATISVNPANNAGNDVPAVTYCASSGSQDLFALLGATAQAGGSWSPALASGSGIFDPTVDPAGTYTYSVSANAACPTDSATVTVFLNPVPNAGTDAVVTYCSDQAVQDLFLLLGATAQPGGTWSPALNSGTGIFDPAIDTAGTYTYSLGGVAPCPSDSSTVTISVTPSVDAGTNGTVALCNDSAPQDLFDYLNGTPQTTGTWSPALASGTGIFDPATDAAGVYTYTILAGAGCANGVATVTVTVNPIPDAGTDGTVAFCSSDAPADLILSLNGTPQAGGTWSPALASGTGVFDPATDLPGVYTYTVGGNLCSTDTASATVTVSPVPDAGTDGTINTCVGITSVDLMSGLSGTPGTGTFTDDNSTGALSGTIFDPSTAGVGTYTFTYSVGGGSSACPADTATVTVVVTASADAGTFTGLQGFCNSATTLDLSTLLSGGQSGGIFTDSNGVAVTNPISLSSVPLGNNSYTYTVSTPCGTDSEAIQFTLLQSPVLTPANFTVASICIGSSATVNFSGMPDGDYTVTYTLSGSNTASSTANVIIAAGTGTITINASALANTGSTTITFGTIVNNANGCGLVLTSVGATFNVNPIATINDAELSAVNVCLGSDVVVSIAGAGGLQDGNYQFNYTIPELTPGTGSTGTIAIAGGTGQFSIPAATFTSAGSYSIVINNIINSATGCNNMAENATTTFTILPVANLAGAVLSAPAICLGQSNVVSITGANNVPDGSYSVSYQLSGASTFTGVTTVVITGGTGSSTIAASDLATAGAVTVTITQFQAVSAVCAATGTIAPITFTVEQALTPSIITDGNLFCGTDNPTVAELSANINGTEPVTWYDAATGGNVVPATALLQNGVTYFASYTTATGCESTVRLAVTADLTDCEIVEEILIPDGFSPNGDGINDDFEIVNLDETYPNFKLEIYNRYGNILYKGTIATPNWDGTSNEGGINVGSNVAPTGVYFYVLEFNDGIKKPIQGRVYLSR